MEKIISDKMRNIYEDVQDKTIVKDLKKQIYLHEVNYLKMLGIDVDSLTGEMDSIVENRVEFFDMVDQEVWQNLSNAFTLFNSKAYQDMRNFSEDYEVSINGTDVIKKDKSKKIA